MKLSPILNRAMMNTVATSVFTLTVLLNVGCASVNSVSLTPIPSQRSRPVHAEVSKTIFLAFSFDNDFVNSLVDDLKKQCPNGTISGILTKDETISYLIVFTKKVTATGFCNAVRTAAATPGQKRRPSGDSPESRKSPGEEAAL